MRMATYHGLNKLHELSDKLRWWENRRNFIIGRGSYVGSHRYAGLWTGDNSSDWDFLKINISQVLSLGMHGLAITGQDIGGFEASAYDNGKWVSPELLIRWTGAGAFLPWFRNHYVRKGRKEFQEVFMYVEWFDQNRGGNIPEPRELYYAVLPICRYYIQLRYRLMQLFYDCLFVNCVNGKPISRPLFLVMNEDQNLYNDKELFLNDEFFVGNDVLVAPVLKPESEDNCNGRRDVYLPHGADFYGFVDGTQPLNEVQEGGSTIRDYDAQIRADPNHIPFIVPIFIRAGAIVPMLDVEQYVGQLNTEGKLNPITLNVYPGADGEYTMYLDDGISRSSAPAAEADDPKANNEYRTVKISQTYKGTNRREVKIERVHDKYKPMEDHFYVALLHDPSEDKGPHSPVTILTVNGRRANFMGCGEHHILKDASQNSWSYHKQSNTTHVKVFDNATTITVEALATMV